MKKTKPAIPPSEQENVLHMFWAILRVLESKSDEKDPLSRLDVEQAYNVLNRIGYTDARPQWEKSTKSEKLQKVQKVTKESVIQSSFRGCSGGNPCGRSEPIVSCPRGGSVRGC